MELSSVAAIVRVLNDAKIIYFIVGGVAVNAHGYVRFTKDIDLVIQLNPPNIESALSALESIGYRLSIPVTASQFSDPETRESWRTEKGMLVLKLWSDLHRRTNIDIFVYEPFDISVELTNILPQEIEPGLIAPIVSLPTLLEMKREAGRDLDIIDITELTRF